MACWNLRKIDSVIQVLLELCIMTNWFLWELFKIICFVKIFVEFNISTIFGEIAFYVNLSVHFLHLPHLTFFTLSLFLCFMIATVWIHIWPSYIWNILIYNWIVVIDEKSCSLQNIKTFSFFIYQHHRLIL